MGVFNFKPDLLLLVFNWKQEFKPEKAVTITSPTLKASCAFWRKTMSKVIIRTNTYVFVEMSRFVLHQKLMEALNYFFSPACLPRTSK